jgi:Lon protease-like protein
VSSLTLRLGVSAVIIWLPLLPNLLKRHNVSMPSRLLPLFPLQVVVFPRTPLPLHIFEDRYKDMVGGAMRDNSEFGVVLAKDGGIVNSGCTVTVEKLLQMYPDGRMDVMTRGQRRFEILSLNEEKDYLQAEVNFFDDEDPIDPSPELRDQALSNYQTLIHLPGADPRPEPDLADRQLSFQLARHLPDLDFLSALLRHRSETERLKQLNQYLALYIPRQRTVERMKELAPTNGHGGKPAGL